MRGHRGKGRSSRTRPGAWHRAVGAALASLAVVVTPPAGAQEKAAPQATRLSGPESGFLGALGRFIERSLPPAKPQDAGPGEGAEAEDAAPAATQVPQESEDAVAPAPASRPAAAPANPLEVSRGLAKDAIDALTRLPSSVALPKIGLPSAIVTGRERCATAVNGAPDCLAATTALCKAKGFSAGSSLDIETAQRCKAHVWLSGRSSGPDDCTLESYVTRAMCR